MRGHPLKPCQHQIESSHTGKNVNRSTIKSELHFVDVSWLPFLRAVQRRKKGLPSNPPARVQSPLPLVVESRKLPLMLLDLDEKRTIFGVSLMAGDVEFAIGHQRAEGFGLKGLKFGILVI